MDGLYPVNVRTLQECWLYSLGEVSQLRFSPDEVDDGQELVGVQNVGHVGTHLVAEHREYAYDLAPFLSLQLAYAVIGLDDLRRLDKYRLSRCRLIVDDAVDAFFQVRCYGDDQSAVAHGWCRVLVHQSVLLCSVQYSI